MESVFRLTVWLHKGPSIFNFGLFWGLIGSVLVLDCDSWFFSRRVPRLTITICNKITAGPQLEKDSVSMSGTASCGRKVSIRVKNIFVSKVSTWFAWTGPNINNNNTYIALIRMRSKRLIYNIIFLSSSFRWEMLWNFLSFLYVEEASNLALITTGRYP